MRCITQTVGISFLLVDLGSPWSEIDFSRGGQIQGLPLPQEVVILELSIVLAVTQTRYTLQEMLKPSIEK